MWYCYFTTLLIFFWVAWTLHDGFKKVREGRPQFACLCYTLCCSIGHSKLYNQAQNQGGEIDILSRWGRDKNHNKGGPHPRISVWLCMVIHDGGCWLPKLRPLRWAGSSVWPLKAFLFLFQTTQSQHPGLPARTVTMFMEIPQKSFLTSRFLHIPPVPSTRPPIGPHPQVPRAHSRKPVSFPWCHWCPGRQTQDGTSCI